MKYNQFQKKEPKCAKQMLLHIMFNVVLYTPMFTVEIKMMMVAYIYMYIGIRPMVWRYGCESRQADRGWNGDVPNSSQTQHSIGHRHGIGMFQVQISMVCMSDVYLNKFSFSQIKGENKNKKKGNSRCFKFSTLLLMLLSPLEIHIYMMLMRGIG